MKEIKFFKGEETISNGINTEVTILRECDDEDCKKKYDELPSHTYWMAGLAIYWDPQA